ncbi:uncharacterized protein LOC126998430 isoform X1 [Eriocheir sinensis]|uniref:uncharacterized protein LOC126998430 isoform X1 n=2 Tax=Eriocheir sinensis TaxID=95602 RepID=UPI0021C8AD09|nr:uncharacterized protein LOC126998430 isoform X1 [Eriocheir sinensis]
MRGGGGRPSEAALGDDFIADRKQAHAGKVMASRESSGNSTRLSLDIANLPLIPFGMRPHASPKKLTPQATNRFNKLSRRRAKHPQVGSGDAGHHRENKENIGGASSGQCSKGWSAIESRVTGLHTVPENEDPPEPSSTQKQRKAASPLSRKFPVTGSLRPNTDSPFVDSAQDTQHALKRSSGQRDSIYTDVDDGSFIEFYHGKEKGQQVPHQPDDSTRKMPLLYYTCESDNDTQYSTSSKTKNALVGFHKYLDKLRLERDLRNIHEEDRTEEVGLRNRLDMYDETIITCSADIRKYFCKPPAADAINSTVIDKLPHTGKTTLPCAFSEISTLTVNPEVVLGSDSQSRSKQPKILGNAKQQTVILSESSDEGESHPTERGAGVKVTPIGSNVKKPPQSVGNIGIVKDIPMFVMGGQARAPCPPPSPKVIVAMHEEWPSLVSEDVSIISNSVAMPRKFPSVVSEDVSIIGKTLESLPQKSSASKIPRTVGVATSPIRGAKVPLVCEDKKKDEENRGDVGHVPLEWRFAPSKDGDAQTTGQTKFPVHKWIMTSPFKESSFDSSFLQRKEDSFISESPSQPKLCYGNEKVMSHTRKFNSEPLIFSDPSKQGKSPQAINKNCDPSLPKEVTHISPSSESSECEFSIKRTAAKERVILSSSDELEENKRNGMFVTQRKKKKHSKNVTSSFKKKYIEASDEEGESLCLRLSKSQNETSEASGKTIQTIGRVAESPDNRVNRPSDPPTQTLQKFKKSPPRRRSKSDSDSFVSMENLPDNSPCLDKLVPDTKVHHSDSVESLALPPPKAGSPQHLYDSDGPLDLSLIRKELDSLYSSEWRKNEEAIFKTVSREGKQRSRVTNSEKSIEGRRRSRSCPRLSSETDEKERENSFVYQVPVSETYGDEESVKSNCSKDTDGSSENSRSCVPYKDEGTAKTPVSSRGSPEDDSFEEYLKKVRSTKKEIQQKIDFSSEDEDKYESSFINDESDESYSLPQVPLNPYKSPPENQGTPRSKVSIPKIKERDRRRERHHSNEDIRPVSSSGNEKTPRIGPEDSFEEYLKKVRSLTQKKKKQQKITCSSEDEDSYESSFINDDSDDESYSLPKVIQKPQGNLPEDKNSIFKSKGRVTTRPNTDKRVINMWHNSPTINQISDSDSSESKEFTENSKKITPQKTYRNKVLPKTEGYCRRAKGYGTSQVSPRLSFLASLSSNVNIIQCHPEALSYVKNFKKKKEELVKKLYNFYNTHVFDCKLPSSMNIAWNARLTKTAGYCYYQINGSSETRRGSRIELSTKVIDSPERLRDTLIHELCHAAAWIISGYKDGHGPLWKAWAAKARAVFPELPAISRCHSYQIQCKYTYRCTRCSYSIGRHSKSLDMEKKVCGYCYGKFELLVNHKTQKGQQKVTPSIPSQGPPKTPKTPGPFAVFVKKNYGSVKKSTPHLKHGDVMRILSTKFGEMKTNGD